MPSFLMIQWGIIGFFVIIHFLIGFLRGTSKSTYYTIVSIIMTIFTLWLVSMLSFSIILSSPAMVESYIQTLNGFTGGAIPDEAIAYLLEPEIMGFAIAIADLLLRIIAYILFYPFVKFSLTFAIFRPIWKHAVLPKLVSKQNEKLKIEHEEKQDSKQKFVAKKRLNKNIFSRLFGGAIGSVRGLVVAFVFLLPLLVLAGFASEIQSSVTVEQNNQNQVLGTNQEVATIIPNEVQEILNNINEMNAGGLSAIVKDIRIQEKSLDRYIFDQVFTTNVKVDDVKTPINFGNELEQIFGIANIVIENGYLDDFQIENISTDDVDNLEAILNHIGQSDLIQYMIPAAVKYGVDNIETLAPQYFSNMSTSDRVATQAALENFYDIAWDEEFSRIFGVADAALTFATVGEWMIYMDQPELLAELSPEEGILFANIFRAFGDLEVLTLLNVAIDYATTLEEVQQQIQWMDPEEVEPYLQERFAFVLDDPDFFIGSEGEIYRIAQIIETIFTDEFGDANLSLLVNSMGDPEALINNQNPEWVGAIIEDLVEVRLIVESIPIGADYAFYTTLKDSMNEALADQIAAELETIVWEDEIVNVSDIYKEALKLGVGSIFGENPDYYAFIDDVAINHMDSLRQIVEYVFEGSEVVNAALEIASPTIIETLVTDVALQDALKDILISDDTSETIDFNFGQELNNILTIFENVNKFSSLSELNGLTSLETNQMLEVISQFSTLEGADYQELRQAINELQILTRAGEPALNFLQSKITSPLLFIPDSIALNQEVVSVLDLAFEVSKYFEQQSPLYLEYQDIDLTGLFEDPDFRAFFMNSTENKHSNLLLINIANNVKNIVETGTLSAYTTLPTALLDAELDSEFWKDEASQITEALFDMMIAAGQTAGMELSYAGILTAANDTSNLPIDAFYQMSENDTFLELFDSQVMHKLISDAFSNPDTQQILVDAVNLAQTIFIAPNDFFMAAPDLMDADLIKPSEFENIVIAVHTLGLIDVASFSTLGIETFTNLLDQNIDPVTGDDDFDRVFGANYIYTLLDKVFKLESLGDYVGATLGNALGLTVNDFDITPSDAMLASDPLVYEPIEIGRIPKVEFRRMIKSFSLIGDIGAIGLDTFTNLIDPSLPSDDFDEFISSDYIYTILARLFDNPAFGDYVGDALAGAFANDPIVLEMAVPSDALGTTSVEEGLITRAEIKKMMVSLDMLDFAETQTVSIATIMDMIGYNVDAVTGDDDFSRFIDSLYIQDKVSQLLLSDQIIEVIANGRFTTVEFVMPASSLVNIDSRDRMIEQEIYDLFYGLKLLTVGDFDFDNPNISLDSVTTLTDQEEDELLSSSYLYVTLDLMLKSEASLSVPDDALEVSGEYDGMIRKDEIKDLLTVFDILGESDPNLIDVNNITIADIQSMIDLDSSILDQMVSDAIIDNLTSVPTTAYNVEGTRISRDELYKMVDTLLVLSDGNDQQTLSGLMPIDPNLLTNQKLTDIHNIDSRIIDRLTSEAIIDSGISIHSKAYDDLSEVDELNQKLDIKRTELAAMLDALDILGISIADTSTIDQTKYTPTNIGLLLDLESLMVYRLISEGVIDQGLQTDESLAEDVIDDNYDPVAPGSDIKVFELEALVEAMIVLNIVNLTDPISVDTVSIAQLEQTHWLGLGINPGGDVYESRIIHRLISDSVTGSITVPNDAYMTIDNLDVEPLEISALIEALGVMGLATLGDPINVDALTLAQLENIHYLGLGTNPTTDIYESLVIHRLISDAVVDSLYAGDPLQAPDGVFMTIANEDLEVSEVSALIEALGEMGLTTLGDPINVDALTLTQLENIHYLGLGTNPTTDVYESLIIHRLISDAVIDTLYTGDPLQAPDGVFMTAANEDLLADEVSALIEALDVMGLTTLSDPINVNALTLTQLENIHYLGLGINPTTDIYESLIIHRLISDSVISTVTVPDDAYMTVANEDVKPLEITALIEALDVMGLTKLSDPINVNGLTVATLKEIHYLGLGTDPVLDVHESLIIHRMVSDAVVDSLYAGDPLQAPDGVFMTVANQDLLADEVSALIAAMEEVGITTLGASLSITNPTRAQLQELHYIGLANDPSGDVYESLIVHRLISDSVVSALSVPDEAYMTVANEDVKEDEISALIAAMEEMGITSLGVGLSVTNPTRTQLQNLHDLGLNVPVGNVYDSYIVHRLISDSVDAALSVPDDAYDSLAQDDIKVDEISALIAAMEEMGITSLGAGLSITNPTRTQLQNLHNLGLNVPVGNVYDSYIVHRLISDSIDTALTVPSDAYMTVAQLDIKVDEISALIEAMTVMNITTLSAGLTFGNPTTTQIRELNYLGLGVNPGIELYDSYIVHRLLSDAIDTVITVPVGSYIVGRPDDIKAEEIEHLVGTMEILGVTNVSDFSGITVADLSGLSAADIEYITEETTSGPNLIVYYFIDDVVDPNETVGLVDANYVMDGATRVRLTRAALADALAAL